MEAKLMTSPEQKQSGFPGRFIVPYVLSVMVALALTIVAPSPLSAKCPSAVYQSSLDRMSVFMTAPNVPGGSHTLMDKYWNGQWMWENQGPGPDPAGVSSTPSAIYQPPLDRIVVFAVARNGHLYDWFYDQQQSGWVPEDQGIPVGVQSLTGDPSAVYQAAEDRDFVFVAGQNGRLYEKSWNGRRWLWQDLGVPPLAGSVSGPSAVYQPTLDRVLVFVTGADGHLYDKYRDGNGFWSDQWEDQGVPPQVDHLYFPSATYQSSSDRIVVFVYGLTGFSSSRLVDKYWDGQQWQWEDQGNPDDTMIASGPAAIYQPTFDRVHVFVTGANGNLYEKYWYGQWIWEDHGNPGVSVVCPAVAYQPTLDRLQVFVIDRSLSPHLYDNYYDGQWRWEDQGVFPF
jgi:hypothetical protein